MSTSTTPVPTPRTIIQDVKKPIPTPRRITKPQQSTGIEGDNEANSKSTCESSGSDDIILISSPTETNTNTFSRRVRSLSKQLAAGLIPEETRESVRKLTRHLSFNQQGKSQHHPTENAPEQDTENLNIFNNIKFDSPITRQTDGIYNNLNPNLTLSNTSLNIPPPSHPPPPFPEEIYDAPQSLASSSTSSRSIEPQRLEEYESVYPREDPRYSTTESWQYYDAVAKDEDEVLEPEKIELRHHEAGSLDVNSNLRQISRESHENSVYENYVPKFNGPVKRPTESVLYEFDPLLARTKETAGARAEGMVYDMEMIDRLLDDDLYSTISRENVHDLDNWSISNESESDEFISPPSPPVRFDSLPDEDQPPPSTTEVRPKITRSHTTVNDRSQSKWYNNGEMATPPRTPDANSTRFSWFHNMIDKAPGVVRGTKNSNRKNTTIPRPLLATNSFVHKQGMLYKVQNGPVEDLFGEYSGRWCALEGQRLKCYSDNSCENLKEQFGAADILSLQKLEDNKYKFRYESDDLHCFQLNVTGKRRGGHIYGSRSSSERRIWMQNIAESLTNKFPAKTLSDYTRIGWCYIRESVTGEWKGAWIVLNQRKLYYATDRHTAKTMDLRKARCIFTPKFQVSDNNPATNDKAPNIVIDCAGEVIYLRLWTMRETKGWSHVIRLAAYNNGANLDQQQLTKSDVPVIVAKCTNYIFTHGSMSEGIYRRSGTNSVVADILTKFRKNAFGVELTPSQCSEFEVATALKRFFRDLPEPLLGSSQRQYLYEVSKQKNKEEKIRMYIAALEQLPPISFNTTKALFEHLHLISSQHEKNLMTTTNLAAIWGPTLMHYEENNVKSKNNHHKDAIVVAQLIDLCPHIFPQEDEKIEKEQIMLKHLEHIQKTLNQTSTNNKKTAGDLMVYVHLNNIDGKAVHVKIGPNRTAYDVCDELSLEMELSVDKLILEEVVLDGRLTRPIHHSEKVLDVVIKWSSWSDNDRKGTHLVITQLSNYNEFIQNEPLPVSGEMKFADCKSRHFKSATFEFSQSNLCQLKEKTGEIVHCWNIHEIIWYLGNEVKRNPQMRSTITFLDIKVTPNRSKQSPHFGNIIAFSNNAIRAKWLAAMWKARYPTDLKPPPKLKK